MKRYIRSTQIFASDAVEEFLAEISNKDILEINPKLLMDARDQLISDFKAVPDDMWGDPVEDLDEMYDKQHRFYIKYVAFAKKCNELLETFNPGSGYGLDNMVQYKIYEILKSIDNNFPYGWKPYGWKRQ